MSQPVPDPAAPRPVPAASGAGAMTAPDWEQRYREGRARWDLGGPAPALVRAIQERPAPPALRVLVPGAGFGHDALAWARAGHRVTSVDVAPSAVEGLRRMAARAGLGVDARLADLFALPPAWGSAFDLVWEQTCFCAIPVERRLDYVRALAEALVPGGTYLGLFWNHGQPGGPPFDIAWPDVRGLFLGRFAEERVLAVPDSVPGRSHETLVTLRRR